MQEPTVLVQSEPIVLDVLEQPLECEQVEVPTTVLSADTFEENLSKLSSAELHSLIEADVKDQNRNLMQIKVVAQLQRRVLANNDTHKFAELDIRGIALEKEHDYMDKHLDLLVAERNHRLRTLESESES